jgi:hypothetical protein
MPPESASRPARPENRPDNVARLPVPEASPLSERANAFINSYWETVTGSGDRVLPYLNSIYAPIVNYYGRPLPKQMILQDKFYFIRRWPIRQTWAAPGAESPNISCNEAAEECDIAGVRDFDAVSPERSARSTGVVRYWYEVRFLDGWPQIVGEQSSVVASD